MVLNLYFKIPDSAEPEILGSLSRFTFLPKPNVYVTVNFISAWSLLFISLSSVL